MEKRNLYLFTTSFPYGNSETFLENEILILSKRFQKVFIFPTFKSAAIRVIPENVEVVDWQKNYSYNGKLVFLKNYFLFKKYFKAELAEGNNAADNSAELRSILLQNIEKSNVISKIVEGDSDALFYSFWFDHWATVLGILKDKGVISNYSARVHGIDLYTELQKNGRIPYRSFQLKSVDKVIAVSLDGFNYLNRKYPRYSAKFRLSHLGVFDHGVNPFETSYKITIVTCSNIAAVKRVDLVAEVMKRVKIKVRWIHFGDGEFKNELIEKTQTLPSNIEFEFKGRVNNAELLQFYQKNSIQLFLQFSKSEGGVPVSLQEAASFGIPLIGTDVGGIPEIVNEETGILIPVDFDPQQVAKMIDEFATSERNSPAFRTRVREFWKSHFEAERNYQLFCDELLKN